MRSHHEFLEEAGERKQDDSGALFEVANLSHKRKAVPSQMISVAMVGYWDGDIEYTEEAIAAIRPIDR